MKIMIAFKIDHNLPRAKMIGLPQINDLSKDFGMS